MLCKNDENDPEMKAIKCDRDCGEVILRAIIYEIVNLNMTWIPVPW